MWQVSCCPRATAASHDIQHEKEVCQNRHILLFLQKPRLPQARALLIPLKIMLPNYIIWQMTFESF